MYNTYKDYLYNIYKCIQIKSTTMRNGRRITPNTLRKCDGSNLRGYKSQSTLGELVSTMNIQKQGGLRYINIYRSK
jgi:hypothetical protein